MPSQISCEPRGSVRTSASWRACAGFVRSYSPKPWNASAAHGCMLVTASVAGERGGRDCRTIVFSVHVPATEPNVATSRGRRGARMSNDAHAACAGQPVVLAVAREVGVVRVAEDVRV